MMTASIIRIYNLIRIDLFEKKGMLQVGAFLFISLWLLIDAEMRFSSMGTSGLGVWRWWILMLAATSLASVSLKRFHREQEVPSFLNLPASAGEHFIKAWFMSVIFPLLATFTLYLIFYCIVLPIVGLLYTGDLVMHRFIDFSSLDGKMCLSYFLGTALFMLGSIHFRTWSFVKVLMSLMLVFIIMQLIFFTLIFQSFFRSMEGVMLNYTSSQSDILIEYSDWEQPVKLFVIFLTLGLYLATYLKLKEKEA